MLLFGPAGVPFSSKAPSSQAGIKRVAELGLGCMELQFVQGVKMSENMAASIAELATLHTVKLTAHAPYFINLNAHDSAKISASQERLLQTARIAAICGAESIVFHAAFYLGNSPTEVYGVVKKYLAEVLELLRKEGNGVLLRPEVTGKESQFGSLQEVLDLSAELDGVMPCIDFPHWHARTGAANSYHEFVDILDQVESRLGRTALENMHIHLSGIAYGKKGESKHLLLQESDFNYGDLLRALKEHRAEGVVICESPNLEEDALLLKRTYESF